MSMEEVPTDSYSAMWSNWMILCISMGKLMATFENPIKQHSVVSSMILRLPLKKIVSYWPILFFFLLSSHFIGCHGMWWICHSGDISVKSNKYRIQVHPQITTLMELNLGKTMINFVFDRCTISVKIYRSKIQPYQFTSRDPVYCPTTKIFWTIICDYVSDECKSSAMFW